MTGRSTKYWYSFPASRHDVRMKPITRKAFVRWKPASKGGNQVVSTEDRVDFLIIDDDKAFRDGTRQLIDGEGHYAESIGSGESGLACLEEDAFDAVLLDL